ncbi:MAG: hypothetical protein R8J85_10350, partial [Mariprofundales bacterium]
VVPELFTTATACPYDGSVTALISTRQHKEQSSALADGCQTASKNDPPSAPKIDPPNGDQITLYF